MTASKNATEIVLRRKPLHTFEQKCTTNPLDKPKKQEKKQA
jgi:hypothetical protein